MSDVQIPSESDILSRVILPTEGSLPEQAAQAILRLAFPEHDIDRMNELASMNRQGKVTDAERDELERYSRVGNLLNLLHAKARCSLRNGQ